MQRNLLDLFTNSTNIRRKRVTHIQIRLKDLWILAGMALLLCAAAFGTDGYFQTGCGITQQGQGGSGVALPADSTFTTMRRHMCS